MSHPSVEQIDRCANIIGLICLAWSNLEYTLAQTLWRLLSLDEEAGIIVTGGLDIEGRAFMAAKLAKSLGKPKELLAELDQTASDIQEIYGERNLAVHGAFGIEPHKKWRVTAEVHRGKYRGSPQVMDEARLAKTFAEIIRVIDRLEPVLCRHGLSDPLPAGLSASLHKSA